ALEAAREHCLSLLATRSRTRFELAESLRRRGADPTVTERVLERLEEVGLVDDQAVAQAYADKQAGRKGPRAIAAALQRQGIDPCLALEVAFARDADDVRTAALTIARQKLPSWRGQPPATVERRLAALLARRGYSSDIVFSVVREVVGTAGAG
ncbi:MAG: regulatory protein RecX, partial [Mycobacteriales bacterium]